MSQIYFQVWPQAELVNALRREKARFEINATQPAADSSMQMFGVATVFFFVFATVMSIAYGLEQKPVVLVRNQRGGDFGTATTPFLDEAAKTLMIDLMSNLTAFCSPLPGDPSLSDAVVGSRARVSASWLSITEAIKLDPTNFTTGCYLYGLEMVRQRAGPELGPVDICHGYVHAADIKFSIHEQAVCIGQVDLTLTD